MDSDDSMDTSLLHPSFIANASITAEEDSLDPTNWQYMMNTEDQEFDRVPYSSGEGSSLEEEDSETSSFSVSLDLLRYDDGLSALEDGGDLYEDSLCESNVPPNGIRMPRSTEDNIASLNPQGDVSYDEIWDQFDAALAELGDDQMQGDPASG
ncbi:hypothetical protein PIIN_10821 [Serendipita indica DSM 11827]|uniref:Uncharacterized protein n=1 Tax=Serendipita indica (strain DSM 11827) TaxID=1109443 RepID=G4TZU2_SERID|nr:hypothetical protein PIIN_10821 [Serendipita indica DSM 11827]